MKELYSVDLTTSLSHHGIKGQKWGVRRYQNYDGSRIKSSDRTYNLEKFGTSKDANILFVTGLSGSGKSTISSSLAKTHNAEHIDLDAYYGEKTRQTNSKLDSYLDKVQPNWRKADHTMFSNDKYNYFQIKDEMMSNIVQWSKELYPNRSVIAEGVEIFNDAVDPRVIDNMPLYIVGTNKKTSMKQAVSRMRDMGESDEYIKELTDKNTEMGRQFIEDYNYNSKKLEDFESDYKKRLQ